MARHRGIFKPENPAPYELSRSRIENFVQCKACFFLKQVKGVTFPSIPGFNINEATDVLLKRDFDQFRGKDQTHPYLAAQGLSHLVPYEHEHFELWTQSMHFGAKDRMHFIHDSTNLKVGGGLDDVWLNTLSNQLHIVDYKSTSQKSPGKTITLDGKWKAAYRRQMDLYVWVMRQKKFDVSTTGFFLYCDGDRFSEDDFLGANEANMKFAMTLIPYEVELDWIEPTLEAIHFCLRETKCPAHETDCEYGKFLAEANAVD